MLAFPQERIVYKSELGTQLYGDSREILKLFPDESVDLIMTSPPFALLRQKSYGNKEQDEYVSWLMEFGREAFRVLKSTGSFVLDLGGAYQKGRPVRSLYNYRVLLSFCDILGYNLAEEFFWFNPSKLPSPIEWVNKRKIRAKDAVNTIWWFSKTDFPKANVQNVLAPYSDRMESLLKDASKYYQPKERPSGHDIGANFGKDNGGAIPPNLLQIPNTESNSHYLRMCKQLGFGSHPARFPIDLPNFFIKFLTDPGDIVLDIFSGSNTTGFAAEKLERHWVSIDLEKEYAIHSATRFMEGKSLLEILTAVNSIKSGEVLDLSKSSEIQPQLNLSLKG